MEEVIVTAEHRTADLQKVAASISVVSGAEIDRNAQTDVNQVLQNVAGVLVQGITDGPSQQSVQGGGGPPNISIRGLGTNAVNTSGAVAIYEDGVVLQGGGANFYDMNRVEVLRGPQGTLYGRSATAGAINFITNDPTQELEASGRVQYGSYDLISTQGMINLPLSDDWAVRAAFNQIRHSGYFNNGMSDEDDLSTRFKLRFKPNDDFLIIFGFVDYKSDGSGPGQVPLSANSRPTGWTTDLAGGGTDPVSYRKADLDLEWNLGFANLTYIGAYQNTDSVWSTAGTFSYLVIPQNVNQTWSNELRLAHTNDSGLSWLVGAYAFQNKLDFQYEPGPTPTVAASSRRSSTMRRTFIPNH